MSSGYFRWNLTDDVYLTLELVNPNGTGATGQIPLVAVQRVKQVGGGVLDGFYLSGSASFISSPTFLSMSEVDNVNQPGLYRYYFSQSLIQQQYVYSVYYKSTVNPIGFGQETHYFLFNTGSTNVSVYSSEPET